MQNTPTPRCPLYAWASAGKFIGVTAILSLIVVSANATTVPPPDGFSEEVLTYAHAASWYLFIVAVIGLLVRRLFEEAVHVWTMIVPMAVTRALANAAHALFVTAAASWRSWTERRRHRD